MSLVTICYRNILENSTVTSTDENANFPLYRTYDRDIGKVFKFNTSPANCYVKANQGASTIWPVNRCIIPVGHTLNGQACRLQYSTDDSNWFDAVYWTQADALIINKSFTEQTKRYWRLIVTSDPSTPLELTELYLTSDHAFSRNVRINTKEGYQPNVVREESVSGRIRLIKNGLQRSYRNYSVLIDATEKTMFTEWNNIFDGTKPFYIQDHNGSWIFMEMLNKFEFQAVGIGNYWDVTLELLEVL